MLPSIKQIIRNLPQTHNDDDGFIGDQLTDEVISKADEFLNLIPTYYRKILEINNITVTPHGTIVIDWYTRKNFVSVEVGKNDIGFFSEMPDGINPIMNNAPFEGPLTLKPIVSALNKLYGRLDT